MNEKLSDDLTSSKSSTFSEVKFGQKRKPTEHEKSMHLKENIEYLPEQIFVEDNQDEDDTIKSQGSPMKSENKFDKFSDFAKGDNFSV